MKNLIVLILLGFSFNISAQLTGELGILDLSANSGINPHTGLAWADGDAYRLVFVSSTIRDASSTDIADYNTHVQDAATAAGLGSVSWYAIGSTAAVEARANTFTTPSDTDGAFFLMNGSEHIATDITDLWTGSVLTRLDLDENGAINTTNTSIWGTWTGVWTGTRPDGTRHPSRFLGSLTEVNLGLARAELNFWVQRSNNADNTIELTIYGMSEVLNVQSIVPIELLNFEAELEGRDKLKLSWETASEENNEFFTVEHSTDASKWTEILNLPGAGNSTSTIAYEAIDRNPSSGLSYYRLKQTDFNGRSTYSKVITFSLDVKDGIEIYPNPAQDILMISGEGYNLGDIKIYNASAQDVTHLTQIEKSVSTEINVNISALSEGIYIIRIKGAVKKLYKLSSF